MKKTLILNIALFLTLNANASFKVTVKNTFGKTIKDAPVEICLSKLNKYNGEKLFIFIDGNEISSQMDDLDRDGKWDVISFIEDFQAYETKKVVLKPGTSKEYTSLVYTSLIKKNIDGSLQQVDSASSDKNDMYNKMHHHGVAFESDKIAYRIYFDNKSTIDIYGKKRYGLELKETNWYPTEEQLSMGFGDDILLVSSWVGNGAIKAWNGEKAIHLEKFSKRTHRIIAKGPVRAIVQSELNDWEYEGEKINLIVRYTLYGCHRDVIADVYSNKPIKNLATGVQQIGGGELFQTDDLVGSWGSWYPQPDTVKYKKETVGLGLYLQKVGHQVQDGVNNLIVFPNTGHQRYYFTTLAMKENENTIKDAREFFIYLKEWKKEINAIEVVY